jgi:hypothetical protein
MSGGILYSPYVPSWRGKGKLYLFIFRLTLRQLLTNKIRERERLLRNKIKDFSTCHGRITSAQ